MLYPYQITSEEQYHQAYKQSLENPEAFWANVAENFYWRKNGIRF
jgi:acetyl-CoA synthetase